jgi:hypothetical protein
MLRLADDVDGAHRQARARATVIYFSSRMEAVRSLLPFIFVSQVNLVNLLTAILAVHRLGEKAIWVSPSSCY